MPRKRCTFHQAGREVDGDDTIAFVVLSPRALRRQPLRAWRWKEDVSLPGQPLLPFPSRDEPMGPLPTAPGPDPEPAPIPAAVLGWRVPGWSAVGSDSVSLAACEVMRCGMCPAGQKGGKKNEDERCKKDAANEKMGKNV